MVKLNRRKFLFRSAAIVAASNLMPGHSIAHLLEPSPREVIIANMKIIQRELQANSMSDCSATALSNIDEVIHRAVNNICAVGVDKLPTPSKEDVAQLFDRKHEWNRSDITSNFGDVPNDVLPVHAMKTVLGKWRAPVNPRHEQFKDGWKLFVNKYAGTLPNM